jgi:sugar lactone lactonase YvrE
MNICCPNIIMMMLLLVGNPAQHVTERLVWPASPQQTKIEFLYSFSSVRDLGIERSFFRKIFDWIVGADETEIAFVKPLNVCDNIRGDIFVTDPGARCVHIFKLKEKKYDQITETQNGSLVSPVAVACAEDGTVYISDSALKTVIIYDKDLSVRFTISGYFQRPTGITIYRGKLYVVDTMLNKIFIFSLNGELLEEYGKRGNGKGEFNFPVFITASKNIYVVDAMNHRVQEFDEQFTFIRSFGQIGNSQGDFASPKGIALDNDNNIYVCDALFNVFQIFGDTGKLLLVVGKQGREHGEFDLPSGICITDDNKIFVVDALNRRVQVFQYYSQK